MGLANSLPIAVATSMGRLAANRYRQSLLQCKPLDLS